MATVEDLNLALVSGSNDKLKEVLDSGIDPDSEDVFGNARLRSIIEQSGWVPAFQGQVETLLAAGADPNLPDAYGDTPLHAAAYDAPEALINVLLQAGGNPNLPNEIGVTAYETALKHGNHGAVSAIEQASTFRHPDRERLRVWGALHLKLQAFLESGLPAGPKRDKGLREIDTFLVEKGLLAPRDKADSTPKPLPPSTIAAVRRGTRERKPRPDGRDLPRLPASPQEVSALILLIACPGGWHSPSRTQGG
ncbi:MAG: hypothetical protein OXI92_11890 [Acidobacteriota bacterium]|nr:hypothetical protein [Acidobacteriota bacterium]